MKTAIVIFMLLAAPIGCASDPNKKLREAKVEEAEAARQQREEAIDKTKDQKVEGIEKRTDLSKDQAEALPEGSEQRAKAQADVTAERQIFEVQSQAKLQKMNARLEEARRKLQVAGPRVPTAIHDRLNIATKQSASVASDLGHLPQVTTERWTDERKRIEGRLAELESLVDEVASQADSNSP